MKVLVTWIGKDDLTVSTAGSLGSSGPIAETLQQRFFDEVFLMSNHPVSKSKSFLTALQKNNKTLINLELVKISTFATRELYVAVRRICQNIVNRSRDRRKLYFLTGTGSQEMDDSLIHIAATHHQSAELIQRPDSNHQTETIEAVLKKSLEKQEHKELNISYHFSPVERTDNPLTLRDRVRDQYNFVREEMAERLTDDLLSKALGAPEFQDIIGESSQMKDVKLKAEQAARTDFPVLIEGETGTGKELIANLIHQRSVRKDQPIIRINCGAIPEGTVDSELFGHEKGAFTGADRRRKGKIELADGGTLFLDEVGELPKSVQVRLLRVLQEKEMERVGGEEVIQVDIRIITATNRSLSEEMIKGTFRDDLFYRLAGLRIQLPPLREREGDVRLLIDHLFSLITEQGNQGLIYKKKDISPKAIDLLVRHQWRGNVRELDNTLKRMVAFSTKETITEADVTAALFRPPKANKSEILGHSLGNGFTLDNVIGEVIRHYVRKAMNEAHNKKSKAAELLGFNNYQTLSNWMKRYDVDF